MARVVVDVMLKPEILDPQGQAVARALPSLGFAGVGSVRIGKRIEIDLDGDPDEQTLSAVRAMAERLLANPVIEDFTVRAEPAGSATAAAATATAGQVGGVDEVGAR